MEENGKDCSCGTYMPVDTQKIEKVELNEDREVEDESVALLMPRKGGISRTLEKPRRNVQWNDKLAEVLEYQPSDVEVDNGDSDFCSCTIM